MTYTAFTSRRLQMHPSSVPTVVSEWHRSLPAVTATSRFVQAGPRVWLAKEPEDGDSDPLQIYAVPGILWLWGRPVRVYLEFSIWSRSESQLSLRPAHLGWPVRSRGYVLRAKTVLDAVDRFTGRTCHLPSGMRTRSHGTKVGRHSDQIGRLNLLAGVSAPRRLLVPGCLTDPTFRGPGPGDTDPVVVQNRWTTPARMGR